MKFVVGNHKKCFKHDDVVALSAYVDATKVEPMVQHNKKYREIIGGAKTDHFIPLPDESDGIIA